MRTRSGWTQRGDPPGGSGMEHQVSTPEHTPSRSPPQTGGSPQGVAWLLRADSSALSVRGPTAPLAVWVTQREEGQCGHQLRQLWEDQRHPWGQDASKPGTMGAGQPIGQLRSRRTSCLLCMSIYIHTHAHIYMHAHRGYAHAHTHRDIHSGTHMCTPTQVHANVHTQVAESPARGPTQAGCSEVPRPQEQGEPPPSQLLTSTQRLHLRHPASRPGARPTARGPDRQPPAGACLRGSFRASLTHSSASISSAAQCAHGNQRERE